MTTAITPQTSGKPHSLMTPFRALRDEFDELFNRLSSDWDGGKWLTKEFSPACDLSETADAFQIRMDVPGIKPEDITVQVTGDSVQISGERKEEKEEKGKTYHRLERRSGSFSQMLRLPTPVNEDKVQAEFSDGVLTVTLPKTEATKVKTVKVKSNGNR
ncbi:MAG: Hsp20/alpha crystallin family protein [Deltaproteobacteria bacterium]